MGESKKEFCVQCDRKLKVSNAETFTEAQIYNCPDCGNIVIRFENEKYQQIYRDIARSVKYGYKSILDYYLEEQNLDSSLKVIRTAMQFLAGMEETDHKSVKLKSSEFFILCITALLNNWSYQYIPEEFRDKIKELRNLSDSDFLKAYPQQKKSEVFYNNYEKLDDAALSITKASALKIASPILKKYGDLQKETEKALGYMLDFLSGQMTDFTGFKERNFELGGDVIETGRLITLANILISAQKNSFTPTKVNGFSDIFKEKISDPVAAAYWLRNLIVSSVKIDYDNLTIHYNFHIPANSSLGDLEFFRKTGEWIKAEVVNLWITGVILIETVDKKAISHLSYDFPIPEETIPEDFQEDPGFVIPDILKNSFPDINALINVEMKKIRAEEEKRAEDLGIDTDSSPFDETDELMDPEETMNMMAEGSVFEGMKVLKSEVSSALKSIDSYLEKNPDDVFAMLDAANFLHSSKEYDKALTYTEKALEIEPDNLSALKLASHLFREKRDMEKLQNYTERILEIEPENFFANITLSSCLMGKLRRDDAIEQLEKTVAFHPKESRPWFMLGTLYAEQEDYEKCIECVKKALDITPGIPVYLLELGVACYFTGRMDEAEDAFLKVLNFNPDEFSANHTLGVIYLMKGQFDLSYKYLEKTLELMPDDVQARIDYGVLLDNDKKMEEAMKNYLMAFEKSPDNISLLKLMGENCHLRKQDPDALKYYQKILELEPEDYETFYLMGKSYTYLNDFEKALECYDKALNNNPDNFDILCAKGHLCSAMNEHDKALETFQAASKVYKGDPLLWFYQGRIHHQRNEMHKAAECFEKALKLMPDDPDFLSAIGTLKADMGDLQGAAGNLEKSLEFAPDNDETNYNLACIYAKLDRKSESLEKLHKAVELNGEWKEFALTDDDFKGYLEDEEFREIVI